MTLAVREIPSRSSPRPEGRRYIVSAASAPTVASRAGADKLLRTEPQVRRYGGFFFIVEQLLERPVPQLASEQVRTAEAVEAAAARVGGGAADDHVVDQSDVDRVRGVAKLARLCEAADYGNWNTAQLTRRA